MIRLFALICLAASSLGAVNAPPWFGAKGNTFGWGGGAVASGGGGPTFPSGAVAYWTLGDDNVWADSVGSESLTEGGTVTTAAGQIGNAASFTPASTPSLTHADDATLSTDGGISWTVVLSVKPNISSGTSQMIEKGYATYCEYRITADYDSDRFFAIMKDGAASVATTDTGNLVQNAWYLVILWYDVGASTFNIQASTTTTQGGVATTSSVSGNTSSPESFRIGYHPADSTYFTGLIDDVAFFKRTLTTQERTDIWTLWKAGTGGP